MASNIFEISDAFIAKLKEKHVLSFPETLELVQDFLYHLYLGRRHLTTFGYGVNNLSNSIRVLYYVKDNRFALMDIDEFGEGFQYDKGSLPPLASCHETVLALLGDDYPLKNRDTLLFALDSYATFSDWFKRLLDNIDSEKRKTIPLQPFGSKGYASAVKEEKEKIVVERKASSPLPVADILPEPDRVMIAPITTPVENVIKNEAEPIVRETEAVIAEPSTLALPEAAPKLVSEEEKGEDKLLFEQEEEKNRLKAALKRRVGIHFGWNELAIFGADLNEMLKLLERGIRRHGLKPLDESWIVVVGYYVEEDVFLGIKKTYAGRVYRSDDITGKPKAEYVDFAFLVNNKERASKANDGVKKVQFKGASFERVIPNAPAFDDDETSGEDGDFIMPSDDLAVKPAKYKRADFGPASVPNSDKMEKRIIEEDESDSDDEPALPLPVADEETPKRWKCPCCPSKNPWHTGTPARTMRRADGSVAYLCAKHKNAKIK